MTIRKLPSDLISKIAAGQVVDRPASVVKELIENALDANADQITIELTKAGIDSLIVVDNGQGMNKSNLKKSYLRHTTSKIKTSEDLTTLKTLGFRGEALASIAAAADLTIQSRTPNSDQGYQLTIENGQLLDTRPVGMPTGTKVTVKNLFSNLPARRKFLKTTSSELQQVLQVVTQQALANPQVKFKLNHNKKDLLQLTSKDSLKTRIRKILALDPDQDMICVDNQIPHFSLLGYSSLPQHARKSRRHFYVFVNNRPVENNLITQIVQRIYRHLIAKGSTPVAALYFQLPTDYIDVNLNPHKTEVAFSDDKPLELLLEGLGEELSSSQQSNTGYQFTQNLPVPLTLHDSKASPAVFTALKNMTQAWETTGTRSDQSIIQIHDLYLVFQTENGLSIIDQHAAHERILYEQFLSAFHQAKKTQKLVPLTKPVKITLTPSETELVEQNKKILKRLGFVLKKVDPNSYRITHVSNLVDPRRASSVFKDLVDDLTENKTIPDVDDKTKQTIAYLACRSAIKAGDSLSQQERKNLLKKLVETKTPFTCPHGRPITLSFSLSQLEKMFQRR